MGDATGPEAERQPLLGNSQGNSRQPQSQSRYQPDDDEAYLADADNAGTHADQTAKTTTATSNTTLDPDTQQGIQQADAVNLVWTRSALIVTYCLIYLNFAIHALEQQTSLQLQPYVVSTFSAHSLIPAVGITTYVLSGVLKLPLAKLIDTWGRPQGLLLTSLLATIGLALLARCRSVATYAAAHLLHGIGVRGFQYVLDIVIADTSSLRDRALALAFTMSPFLVTTFVGPPLAQWFLARAGSWRLAFAVFACAVPLMAAPVVGVLHANTMKARRLGVLKDGESKRSWREACWHYAVEFDGMSNLVRDDDDNDELTKSVCTPITAVGVILIGLGTTLFLLPFSIAGSAGSKWTSWPILSMLLVGALLLPSFVLYERYYAPKPFMPFHLLLSRNVLGAFSLSAALFIAYNCWDGYYTSYLQVVHQLSVSQAGYVANIFSLGSSAWGLVVGWLIRRTDRFKWLAQLALPIQLLGAGLMVIFRTPHTPIIYVILCQALLAVAGGTMAVTQQMAVMAVAKHGQVAALLALLGLASAVGAGIGSSVSGAIWTNTVYAELLRRLPEDARGDAWRIYEDLELQLQYPVGDPVREAIMQAYGVAQRRMVLAGLAAQLVAIPAVAVWRDVRVSQFKQVKGRVL